MGSDDDTYVPNPVVVVQELESPSTAKTTPLDDRGGADRSGPSSPSSRRHQEQMQDLMDTSVVMDVPQASKDNLIDESKALIKELNFTPVASIRSDNANLTPLDRNAEGGGSGAPCLRSFTQEEQVKNLKTNFKHILRGHCS